MLLHLKRQGEKSDTAGSVGEQWRSALASGAVPTGEQWKEKKPAVYTSAQVSEVVRYFVQKKQNKSSKPEKGSGNAKEAGSGYTSKGTGQLDKESKAMAATLGKEGDYYKAAGE